MENNDSWEAAIIVDGIHRWSAFKEKQIRNIAALELSEIQIFVISKTLIEVRPHVEYLLTRRLANITLLIKYRMTPYKKKEENSNGYHSL